MATKSSAGVAKASLELDHDTSAADFSLADLAIADGVEDEKCPIPDYRTTYEDIQEFKRLLATCDRERIPIEWVIDIADESNGWFYATAYHYNDVTNMLHVMVPDKENPTFDGEVQLDHRTVHLIECVDGRSMALYHKIMRESVYKIKWDCEWYEERVDDNHVLIENSGRWIPSVARYYIRIGNQLLVEDNQLDENGETKGGLVIVTADMNVKLIECHKGRGLEDFNRLILDGVVQSTPEALEAARIEHEEGDAHTHGDDDDPITITTSTVHGTTSSGHHSQHHSKEREKDRSSGGSGGGGGGERESSSSSSTRRKLADYARTLRECVLDITEDFDNRRTEETMLADLFHSFVLDGDLDEGVQLMKHFESVRRNAHTDRREEDDDDDDHSRGDEDHYAASTRRNNIRMEGILEDAKATANKLEKYLVKMARSSSEGRDEHDRARRR